MKKNDFLLSIARQKADQIIAYDHEVQAILITGSIAIGQADDASDIDLIVYYHEAPSANVLQNERVLAEQSGGGLLRSTDKMNVFNHYIQGVYCELCYFVSDLIDNIINDVVIRFDTDSVKHQVASGVLQSLPLYDHHGLIEEWKNRLQNYPEELAAELVKKNLKFYSKPIFKQMGLERGDFVFLAEIMLKTQEKIVGILCGLNRMYSPGKLKRMSQTIGLMQIKPDDMLGRFMQIWQVEPNHAVEALIQLVYDTFDLVDRYMPEVSTAEARQKFEVT